MSKSNYYRIFFALVGCSVKQYIQLRRMSLAATDIANNNLRIIDIAVKKSKYKYNEWAWTEFIDWISKSKEYCFGEYWFFEEYKINQPRIEMETDMALYMPVKPLT